MALIELSEITFGYKRGEPVIRKLSLSLHKGQRVLLTGGNGAGKTSLFHLITGFLQPSEGEIRLFGKKCTAERDFFAPRKKIGLLFQDPDDQLFSPSVLEDVAFGPLNLGFSHKEALDISRNTLELLGIRHLEKRVPYELSGGEKRLVALATILAMKPKVLLLDEPLAGLEKSAVERFLNILRQFECEAMIIISHLPERLGEIVNCHLMLEKGQIHHVFP